MKKKLINIALIAALFGILCSSCAPPRQAAPPPPPPGAPAGPSK